MHRTTAVLGALLVAATVCPRVSHAQKYPVKPVRLLVGWAPGGGVDVTARLVAQHLLPAWEEQIIVDNRPGAAGNLAADLVAKANPDGYTVLLGSIGELAINASLFANLPYNPIKNFSHLTMAVRVPNILVVHPSVPAKDVRELIEYSKKQAKGLSFASPGAGSIGHLTGELLKSLSGANFVHVPYKGAAPATTDTVAGQVQLSFSSMPAVLPFVKAGRLRALAVTSAQRVDAVPDLPTIAESGVPGFDAVGWYAFVGPAGMPNAVVTKLNADVVRVLETRDVKSALAVQGLESWTMSPDALRKYMQAEIVRWSKVVAAAGTRLE